MQKITGGQVREVVVAALKSRGIAVFSHAAPQERTGEEHIFFIGGKADGFEAGRAAVEAAMRGVVPGAPTVYLAGIGTTHGGVQGTLRSAVRSGNHLPLTGLGLPKSHSPRDVQAYLARQNKAEIAVLRVTWERPYRTRGLG